MQYQRAQELEREFDALIVLITAQAERHVPTLKTGSPEKIALHALVGGMSVNAKGAATPG